jgi:hypothetical protein
VVDIYGLSLMVTEMRSERLSDLDVRKQNPLVIEKSIV